MKSEESEKNKKGTAAQSFEDLHVYQRARELTNAIYVLTRQSPFSRDYGLVGQIRRASVSILSNAAEGFERGTNVEFIQFLYIAKGSCGEVHAQLQIAHDQQYISDADYARLSDLAHLTSGMISNFIAHLQQTGYSGEKFVRPRRQAVAKREAQMAVRREAQLVNIRAREARERKGEV